MAILYLFSFQILRGCGQGQKVAETAYLYIITMMPSILLMSQHDLQRKFLIQLDKPFAQMVIQICAVPVQLGFNWITVKKYDLDIYGLSIATFITNLMVYLSLLAFTSR